MPHCAGLATPTISRLALVFSPALMRRSTNVLERNPPWWWRMQRRSPLLVKRLTDTCVKLVGPLRSRLFSPLRQCCTLLKPTFNFSKPNCNQVLRFPSWLVQERSTTSPNSPRNASSGVICVLPPPPRWTATRRLEPRSPPTVSSKQWRVQRHGHCWPTSIFSLLRPPR